jgi:hypothetical protein
LASEFENTRSGLIGKDRAYFRIESAPVDRAANGLEVGAAAGTEHAQA